MRKVSPWTPERDAQLGELWRLKLSTAEIARRTGMSKNSIIGRAHRIGLVPRRPAIDPAKRNLASFDKAVREKVYFGCRFIAGDPLAVASKPYRDVICNKRVVRAGAVYCAEHEKLTHQAGSHLPLTPAP